MTMTDEPTTGHPDDPGTFEGAPPLPPEPRDPQPRPTQWRCGRFLLELDRPLVMGILNVTPDSFSDGGKFLGAGKADVRAAAEAGVAMAEEGADIIDVGGESTRPGAMSVHPAMEASRVIPVVERLVAAVDVPIPLDTRHSEVASAALAAGASIVNDISGFRDPAMVRFVADSEAGLVVMHMQGDPQTMQNEPTYEDVVAEVAEWLAVRADELEAAGVDRMRIAVDPGIGFGKTADHNLALLHDTRKLVALGRPLVIGASRKRFIGTVTGGDPEERLEGSLAAALWAAAHGAAVLRVHDVGPTVKTLRMLGAIMSGRSDS
jgi:dihydropteroate synthase